MEFPLPFSLDCLPPETCVVGGAVRDALLCRSRAVLDLDLVVPVDAVALAREIATKYRAGFVLLDAERSIARLVFAGVTVDFAQQMGGSLLADLQRRDYRMNAIAYHLTSQELIDPLDGAADLQAKVVRMVAADNLAADPLRILRGYRQAAQLGFELDPETEQVIQELAPRLPEMAAERIMTELRYLLAASHVDPRWLGAAAALLIDWLPVNRANLVAELQNVTQALQIVQQRSLELWAELQIPLRSTLPTTPAEIALLCSWLGSCQRQELLTNLTMSSAEINAIQIGQQCSVLPIPNPTATVELYELFQKARQHFPLVVVLWLANGAAWEELHFCINHYLDPQDDLAHPIPLLNGSELMSGLNLSPSPLIGQLLAAIQLARIQGKISTKSEALTFAQSQVYEM